MSDTIFVDSCDRYWDAGLPAMPLRAYTPNGGRDGKPTGKEAFVLNWQSLHGRMPTDAEKAAWKVFHRNGNIGLPLGQQSGLIAIDIDTDDKTLVNAILSVLPPSPWKRVGRKGMMLVYKFEGQPISRLKYKDKDGKLQTLVEILSTGSQIVLPPSIHPNTAKPYTANAHLADVLDRVQSLPANIEQRLREVMTKAGLQVGTSNHGAATDYISVGSRDTSLVSLAGLFARDVLKGERTLLEALREIEMKAAVFMEKTYGDNIDPDKGPKKLIEFLIRDVAGPKAKTLPSGWDEGLTPEQKEKWGLDQFSEDNESWSSDKLRLYFDAQLEECGVENAPDKFMGLVKRMLAKMASNDNVDDLETDTLIRYMAELSDRKITVAALRRHLTQLRRGPIAGTSHAEIAEAVIADLQETGGEIRFHHEQLWQWEGSHWMPMDEGLILKHIILEYGSYKAATRASDHQGIIRTIRGSTQKELVTTPMSGINFVNGFLTSDLELLDHNPAYGATYTLPYPYLPEKAGKCPRWQKMLFDYWGDDADYKEKVNALGEVMAMTLFGKMTEVQRAVCLYGVGHSGKSRIMEIMQALMSKDGQTSLPPTMWGDRFGPAQLVGKSLNFAGELSEHAKIAGDTFKSIISGEVINAQNKNKPLFTFRPKAAHWFASNYLPKSHDSSDGFTRRWLFLVFNKAFPGGSSRINDYHEIVVAEERDAIAAWVVRHMVQLKENGFQISEPPSSLEHRETLENGLNNVRDFFVTSRDNGYMLIGSEACNHLTDDQNYSIPMYLYTEYKTFCLSQESVRVNQAIFIRRAIHLQGKLGFKEDKIPGPDGRAVQVFRNIVFVKNTKANGTK